MAVTLPTLMTRLQDTVTAVTPTLYAGESTFRLVDDMPVFLNEMAMSSGMERVFQVWMGESGREGHIQYPGVGEWVQEFEIWIAYPWAADLATLHRRIMQDFHDVKKALDDPANWGDDVMHQYVPEWTGPTRFAKKAFIRPITVVIQALLAR